MNKKGIEHPYRDCAIMKPVSTTNKTLDSLDLHRNIFKLNELQDILKYSSIT